jgi:urease accessory protein UreE
MASNPFRSVNLTDEERERRRNRLKSRQAEAA